MKTIGTRIEVMHNKALKTSGGLFKKDLKTNKSGSIVSIKASTAAHNSQNLVKAGWVCKKGKFGSTKIVNEKTNKTPTKEKTQKKNKTNKTPTKEKSKKKNKTKKTGGNIENSIVEKKIDNPLKTDYTFF